jgi:hypothetical protein
MATPIEQKCRLDYEALTGPQTDEEWAGVKATNSLVGPVDFVHFRQKLSAGTEATAPPPEIETPEEETVESLRTQLALANTRIAELTSEKDAVGVEATDFRSRLVILERERDLATSRERYAAKELPDNHRYSPEAIGVLATFEVEKTPEAHAALLALMDANSGQLPTVPMGEMPGIMATGSLPDDEDARWARHKAELVGSGAGSRATVVETIKGANPGMTWDEARRREAISRMHG